LVEILEPIQSVEGSCKIPKQGFSDGTFDKWFHKAIFWSQVNPFPVQNIQVFIFKAIESGGTKSIFYHSY
jgi:hypothetical protein